MRTVTITALLAGLLTCPVGAQFEGIEATFQAEGSTTVAGSDQPGAPEVNQSDSPGGDRQSPPDLVEPASSQPAENMETTTDAAGQEADESQPDSGPSSDSSVAETDNSPPADKHKKHRRRKHRNTQPAPDDMHAVDDVEIDLQPEFPSTATTIPKRAHTKSLDEWFAFRGWRVGVILVLATLAVFASNSLARDLESYVNTEKAGLELRKRGRTLSSVIRYFLIVVITAVAAMMILKELDLDIGPILAGAGVLGLAVGFGAQNLVKDIIAGFFILFEDQIRVGDVVTVAEKTGLVERVTLRMVVLRDVRGRVHYIPSGEIGVVTNDTKEFSRYLFEITVGYRENVDNIIEILRQIDESLRADPAWGDFIVKPLDVLGVDRFESAGVVIKARTTTKPNKQWRVGREFNRRLKNKFDELGIEFPYPHLTINTGVKEMVDSRAIEELLKNNGKDKSARDDS